MTQAYIAMCAIRSAAPHSYYAEARVETRFDRSCRPRAALTAISTSPRLAPAGAEVEGRSDVHYMYTLGNTNES